MIRRIKNVDSGGKMLADFPIGVIDSGIGGTTTLDKMRELMPHEDFF